MATKQATDMTVPCPACGTPRVLSLAGWNATMNDRPKWNKKTQTYDRPPGPDQPIECYACKDSYPAHRWHRAYERQEFRKKGWVTPAMLGGEI